MTIISYAKPQLVRANNPSIDTEGNPYKLTLVNQSASPWMFYAFQRVPNQQSANVFSTAWFCSPYLMTTGSQIQFEWDVDYGFVWGNTGEVIPGVTFTASGQVPADPQGRNTTTFSTVPGPNLSPAIQAPPQGSLVINDASNVPNNRFAVGISMSGAGTFVTEAGPNLIHTFTPTPKYWIAAGRNVQVGTVLGITTVNQSLQVTFPPNIRELTYILNTNNQWVLR